MRFTLRNILLLYVLLPAAVGFLLWWGCQPFELEPPPVELLAQEVSFSLGRDVVRLPLIAVTSFGRPRVSVVCREPKSQACSSSLQNLVRLSRKGTKPVPADFLEIHLSDYSVFAYPGRDGRRVGIPEICPKLSQKWAREICESGGINCYLNDFYLVSKDRLKRRNPKYRFRGSWNNLGEIIQSLPAVTDKPKTVCLDGCVAVVETGSDSVAIWRTSQPSLHPSSNLDSEAKFIKSFIKYALGKEENFPKLSTVCKRIT
jgi:hypothetical protein